MASLSTGWETWFILPASVGGLVAAGLLLRALLFRLLNAMARNSGSVIGHSLLQHGRKPAAIIFPLMLFFLFLPALRLAPETSGTILRWVEIAGIISITWMLISFSHVVSDYAFSKYQIDVRDNLQARRIRTQILVLRRIFVIFTGVVGLAMVLMAFPAIRHIGTGLFASAGIVGLVAGIAARSTFINLVAGLQIALSQPIRLDDVVVVQGEWGRIEEIRTTFVVVRIWDERRLVVPLNYFIENPFENWTRASAELLGTVLIYTDYTAPVEEVRIELGRILRASPLWDRRVWNLQVTDAREQTVELRALMSAEDSSKLWDLRCEVREKLLAYLRQNHPGALPRTRAEVNVDGGRLS